MERTDLLKRLSDRELEHWQSRGLSPVKSKQLATEKMKELRPQSSWRPPRMTLEVENNHGFLFPFCSHFWGSRGTMRDYEGQTRLEIVGVLRQIQYS